jgi:hypothetical protein
MLGVALRLPLPGIEARNAPPGSARPPGRAGAFATSHTRATVPVFDRHKAHSTKVAAPPRGRALSGGAALAKGGL